MLHVLNPGVAGGLESVVRLLAAGQRRAGHTVHLAATTAEPGPLPPVIAGLQDEGVVVTSLVIPGRGYLKERRELRAMCERLHPSVMHSHGYRSDVIGGFAARAAGVPVVTTVHGFTGGDWKNRLYERVQRAAIRRFDAVVAVSRPLADSIAADGVSRARLHLLPNAYDSRARGLSRKDARQKLGLMDGMRHVGWVGRLSHEKGADVLLQAISRLDDRTVVTSVIGSGHEEPRLRALADQLGLGGRVMWHGLVPDAGSYFAAFDVFVMSSRAEGTPIVAFEAMAAEVPIVATAVGGLPDVLAGDVAELVPNEDADALASRIRAVLADPAGAARRARAARLRLESVYGVEPWLARYDTIYRGVRAARANSST
ncbi:MAG TPA: glycosyltransferase [Gemmatimonadaceae bacterium]|nr:glycosyltransferase [Gemmatimonadaceae bacterium]